MERRKTNKKYRVKSKFRFITSLVIALGLCMGLVGFITGTNTSTAITKNDCTEVTVVAGDTLWDIAEFVKSRDMDTREAVYEICKANDIKAGDIQPGMILTIPGYL